MVQRWRNRKKWHDAQYIPLPDQDPDALNKVEMTEAPDKAPDPFPGQYASEEKKPEQNNIIQSNPG